MKRFRTHRSLLATGLIVTGGLMLAGCNNESSSPPLGNAGAGSQTTGAMPTPGATNNYPTYQSTSSEGGAGMQSTSGTTGAGMQSTTGMYGAGMQSTTGTNGAGMQSTTGMNGAGMQDTNNMGGLGMEGTANTGGAGMEDTNG